MRELFATLEPFVFHQVIQSFKATHIGLGESSVGGTLLVLVVAYIMIAGRGAAEGTSEARE